MKEVLGSLPEVITAYKNYNLLVPTATDVQLNPFYKFHVEEVPVDLGENSGDIFKVGSVKTGKQDEKGKDIWEDVFSLSKPLLNKMAMAAGIQFNPKETYGERIDRVTYRAQAQGAMRKADGTARTETDQKVICLEDEEEKYRIEFADKAAKGITDEKQAQAAAEIFSGQWVESKNKWGKKCQAFVVAKEDRDRYVERSVMVNMALLKKTWAEKAMTGAKLRVIRALLGVKGTYTKAELLKNFAIPTVIFSPDFSDPQVRQAMLTQGISVNDPACGAGATLVAAANIFHRKKINYQTRVLFTANDIDRVVAQMCYIQLSLLGCAGWVAVANTISNPVCGDPLMPVEKPGQEFWYTPFYFREEWNCRRQVQIFKEICGSWITPIEERNPGKITFYFDFEKGEYKCQNS